MNIVLAILGGLSILIVLFVILDFAYGDSPR